MGGKKSFTVARGLAFNKRSWNGFERVEKV